MNYLQLHYIYLFVLHTFDFICQMLYFYLEYLNILFEYKYLCLL